jgi:hypothetical protein
MSAMKVKPPAAENASRVAQLVGEIAGLKKDLDRAEGNLVGSKIRLGMRLLQLRAEAKRTWAQQLKTLGFSPRVASRYLLLGESELAGIGPNGSDLLARLPAEMHKLEWLCRLTIDQLRELLDNLDCKDTERGQVIAAVKKALGQADEAPTAPDIVKATARIFKTLRAAIDQLRGATPSQEQERLRALLADHFQRSSQELALAPENPEVQPVADPENNVNGAVAQ